MWHRVEKEREEKGERAGGGNRRRVKKLKKGKEGSKGNRDVGGVVCASELSVPSHWHLTTGQRQSLGGGPKSAEVGVAQAVPANST